MTPSSIGGKPIELNDDETIIWQGRPEQGIIRNPVHIGWGLALSALGLWLIISNLGFPLRAKAVAGLVLFFTGGYLVCFHAIVEKNRRATTFYALTNQRAILAYSLGILAYPVSPTARITLRKGTYDTVFLAFNQQTTARLRGIGFGHLKNGDPVYNLMRDIQKKLANKPGNIGIWRCK